MLSGQNSNDKMPLPKTLIQKKCLPQPRNPNPQLKPQTHKSVTFHMQAYCPWHSDQTPFEIYDIYFQPILSQDYFMIASCTTCTCYVFLSDVICSMLPGRFQSFSCLLQSMASELNMYESQVSEYKYEIERLARELQDVKKKYYMQKKKDQAAR